MIFEEYKNLLYFIIASYVSAPEDCADLLSETFLKVLENKKKVPEKPVELKNYLSQIAKNEALQFLRKNREEPLDSIDELYGEEDRGNTMLEILGPNLTSKETIVLYYRAVFGYPWKDISKETGIPESTAKASYSKAKEKLRKELSK